MAATDCLVMPARAAMSETRDPSERRVANTALRLWRTSGKPRAAAPDTRSATIARFTRSTRAMEERRLSR